MPNTANTPLPKLIIIGRDGVVNHPREGGITSAEQWKPIEGSLAAITRLNHAGIKVCVISNEPGIAIGDLDYDGLFAINDAMHTALEQAGGHLDGIAFSPDPADRDSDSRPPKPGLLEEIQRRTQLSLDGVPVVCVTEEDAQASRAVGAAPIILGVDGAPSTLQEVVSDLLNNRG